MSLPGFGAWKLNGKIEMKFISITFLASLLCGCGTLKQMAPNTWYATWTEGDTLNKGQNSIALGVSGALPWGKQ